MSPDYAPTPEQQAIIDAFTRELDAPPSGRRHLIIGAGAGTGKTSSLRMMSQAVPQARGLYIAFNKSVADSASRVFGPNVECRTSHSLAYRHIMNSEYAPLMDKMKTGPQRDERQKIFQDFNMAQRRVVVMEKRHSGPKERVVGGFQLVSLALSVIERFCQTGAAEPSAAHVVPPRDFVPVNMPKYRKVVWAQVQHLVAALWDDMLNPQGKYMRFSHSAYLKLWSLSGPVLPYDYILLDEAQDTAPVTESVVMRQADHALLVMVGDSSQAIYGFTGAHDSMDRFSKSGISYEPLELTASWRFGDEIAQAANALLSHTERTMRITGRGPKGQVLHHLSDVIKESPSVYVCRTNFDVIEAALDAIAQGLTVDTSSVDLTDVEQFLEGVKELKAGQRTKKGGLGPYSQWAEFELDFEDGVPMTEGQRVGMMLLNKYTTEDESARKISLIRGSSSGSKADVKVITIHKAKGGEWLDVSVRFATAFRKVRSRDNREQMWWELSDPNLAYVAVTRAIEALDPGHLWPVVEYGIVCEPSVLLSRARAVASSLTAAERTNLLEVRTDEDLAAFTSSRRKRWVDVLTQAGVRHAETAAPSFTRLLRDVVVADSRAQKKAAAETSETVKVSKNSEVLAL